MKRMSGLNAKRRPCCGQGMSPSTHLLEKFMHKHIRLFALTLALGIAAGFAAPAKAMPNDRCSSVSRFLETYQPNMYTIGWGIMYGLQNWYQENCFS
jgi:hypothetical protein